MLKQVFIFITAIAMFIIAISALEFLVPLSLGINAISPDLLNDPSAIESFMSRQPAAYYIGMVLVHFIGAMVGGLVLGLGGLPRWTVYLLAAACMGVGFALMLPGQPTWYRILDLVNYIPGALLGYEWVARTRTLVANKAKQS